EICRPLNCERPVNPFHKRSAHCGLIRQVTRFADSAGCHADPPAIFLPNRSNASIKSLPDFTICSPVSYAHKAQYCSTTRSLGKMRAGTEKELSCSILSKYAESGSSICLAGPGFRRYFRRNTRANSLASFESSSCRIIRQVSKDRMGSHSGRTTTPSGGSSKALG